MTKREREDDDLILNLEAYKRKRHLDLYTEKDNYILNLVDNTYKQKNEYIHYIKKWLLDEYKIKRYILTGYPIIFKFEDMVGYPLGPDTYQNFMKHNSSSIFDALCEDLPQKRFKLSFDYKEEKTTVSLIFL